MSDISKACIDGANAALKAFDAVDLEKYVLAVWNKAKEYPDLKGTAGIERAIQDIGDEQAQMYMEQMQIKVNDKAKLDERSKPIESKVTKLLNTLVRRWDNFSNNIESAQNAARKTLMDSFFNILTADETAFIHNKRNDIDIMRALDNKPASDAAKAIAKKFEGYIEKRNAESVNSNVIPLSNINKDRVLKAIHDAGKILRGGRNLIESALSKKYTVEAAKDLWKESIKLLLNLEKTFEGMPVLNLDGSVDKQKLDTALNEIFDSITTGKAETIGGSGKSQEMFFYWKDNESWMRYNQKYGRGNLRDAMMADIQTSANKIGMSNMFGSNPQATYNALAELENTVNPQSATAKYFTKLNYNWLAGVDRAPVSATINGYFSAMRGLTGSAKLVGRMTILSLPDITNGIMFAHRHGYSYFKAYGVYLSGMFNALKTDERQYIAGLFKEMTNTHSGYMARFIDAHNGGEVINNFNNILYRATFMDALDKGNKISALQIMSRILGDNSSFEHAALNDTAKAMLNKFNVSENEWNGLRQKVKTLNGKKLLSLDSVESLTNDEIRKIYGSEDNRPLYQLKNELHRKVYSMFDVASENSVLTPGAFMKASSNLGIRSGTIVGEILKSLLQFKMYPLEFADRVLMQGLGSADGVQNKLKFAALLFGATLPMSWLTMYLDNYSKGKTMPDWDKMSFSEKVNYSKDLLLPGLGFMGTFLSTNNQNPSKAGNFISTPALQFLYEGVAGPLAIAEGTIEGDKKKVKNAFKAIGKSIIPGQGLPFVSPYMRQMFGDKPYLQPGQKQLYGA